MRAFVAIPLPQEVQNCLAAAQGRLRSHLSGTPLRWVLSSQIHLTLVFLGDVPAERLQALVVALGAACGRHAPFALALESLGAFPDRSRPQVLWAGLGGDLEGLGKLQTAVRTATLGYGDHQEAKAFHPHLTLARVSGRNCGIPRLLEAITTAERLLVSPPWSVREVHLFRSDLRPEGAAHTSLAVASLASASAPLF